MTRSLQHVKRTSLLTANITRYTNIVNYKPQYNGDANAKSINRLKLINHYNNVNSSTLKFTKFPSLNVLRRSYSTSNNYKFPDMSNYQKETDPGMFRPRAFTYLMVGGMGAVTAVVAKKSIIGFIKTLNPARDTLAMAKIEVELGSIPVGTNAIIKWRGKPVFIRHRTQSEIEEATKTDHMKLRHPESDEERTKRPEWLVMIGICTHLGCVPIGESGDYGGWYCPCHGSHYDISGRIRQGPAPLNLEVPQYSFDETGEKITIG